MRSLIAAAAIGAFTATGACSQNRQESPGPTVSRDFQVGNFNKIEVAGPYDVQVRTGAAASASARGPEKMIERMVVEVKDGKLQIHPRETKGFNFHWGSNGNVELIVTVPQLSAASIGGISSCSVASSPAHTGPIRSGRHDASCPSFAMPPRSCAAASAVLRASSR